MVCPNIGEKYYFWTTCFETFHFKKRFPAHATFWQWIEPNCLFLFYYYFFYKWGRQEESKGQYSNLIMKKVAWHAIVAYVANLNVKCRTGSNFVKYGMRSNFLGIFEICHFWTTYFEKCYFKKNVCSPCHFLIVDLTELLSFSFLQIKKAKGRKTANIVIW